MISPSIYVLWLEVEGMVGFHKGQCMQHVHVVAVLAGA